MGLWQGVAARTPILPMGPMFVWRAAGFVGAVSPKGTSFGAPQRLTFVDNATAGANAARFVAERLAIVDHVFAPLAWVFG